MNSRQKRRFRSYGLSSEELKTSTETAKKELKQECEKARKERCLYMNFHKTDEKLKEILRQGRALYLGGKHIGSKPLEKIKARIKDVTCKIEKYTRAVKQVEALRKEAEEQTNAQENIQENAD